MNSFQRWSWSPDTLEVTKIQGYTSLSNREQKIVNKLLTRVHRSKLARLIIENLILRNSIASVEACSSIIKDVFNKAVDLLKNMPLEDQPKQVKNDTAVLDSKDATDNKKSLLNTATDLQLVWMSKDLTLGCEYIDLSKIGGRQGARIKKQ